MNGRCLLIKRLVKIEILRINLDFIDCLKLVKVQRSGIDTIKYHT